MRCLAASSHKMLAAHHTWARPTECLGAVVRRTQRPSVVLARNKPAVGRSSCGSRSLICCQAACDGGDPTGARGPAPPAVKPHGGLLRYLTRLTKEEQVDVLSKLATAGFATPGREDNVDTLSNDILEKLGIEPQGLRSELLKAFALSGPSKVVVLVDEEGTEEVVEFVSKRNFELWAATNTIKLSLEDGRKQYINAWKQLQDGGRYHTTRTLEKTVSDLENYQQSLDKGLEDEVAERALDDMRVHHKEAKRMFCGRGGVLHNKRLGLKRQIDEILVAENCFKVLEVKQVLDQDAAEQLVSAMEFIKQGIADGQADFDFARRSDGKLKEMKGALGGHRMVPVEQHEQKLKQRIAEEHWGLYLVGGGRIGHGSSCHEMPPPA